MIKTARLQLIPCGLKHFEAIFSSDADVARLLEVSVAKEWLGFPAAREAMQPSYEYLKAHPSVLGWWTYLFVYVRDNALIGLGGFKGPPAEDGIVEIGYALAPAYRGKGLATEAANGFIAHAFQDSQVIQVDAHTLPQRNASTAVLQRVGMKHAGTVNDAVDGEVWRWSLRRNEYLSQQAR